MVVREPTDLRVDWFRVSLRLALLGYHEWRHPHVGRVINHCSAEEHEHRAHSVVLEFFCYFC